MSWQWLLCIFLSSFVLPGAGNSVLNDRIIKFVNAHFNFERRAQLVDIELKHNFAVESELGDYYLKHNKASDAEKQQFYQDYENVEKKCFDHTDVLVRNTASEILQKASKLGVEYHSRSKEHPHHFTVPLIKDEFKQIHKIINGLPTAQRKMFDQDCGLLAQIFYDVDEVLTEAQNKLKRKNEEKTPEHF